VINGVEPFPVELVVKSGWMRRTATRPERFMPKGASRIIVGLNPIFRASFSTPFKYDTNSSAVFRTQWFVRSLAPTSVKCGDGWR
jgi:hypothetical protein